MNTRKEEEPKTNVGRLRRLSCGYRQHGVRNHERIGQMTRLTRVISDKTLKTQRLPVLTASSAFSQDRY
jgi:hypothetical protein